jgi:hypothetical protein
LLVSQGFTERDKLDQHLKRHTSQDGQDTPTTTTSSSSSTSSHCSTNSLAQILKDGMPKEPISFNPADLAHKQDDRDATSRDATITPVNHRASPAMSSHSPRALSASSPLSNAGSASPFPGLPPGFPASPFAMVRYPPISVAGPGGLPTSLASQSPLLLPPGVPHFLPNNLLLPGMGSPFQRFPADPSAMAAAVARLQSPNSVFDPLKPQSPGSHLDDRKPMKRSSSSTGLLEEESPESKKYRLQSSMRMFKDEPVPDGYMRFRYCFS